MMVSNYIRPIFPIAIFSINMIGCFLIGLLMGWIENQLIGADDLKLILVVGFCGGFTTFSAFTYENIQLLQSNHIGTAFLYISLSMIVGITLTGLGFFLTKP
jgi:CrcB protein